MSKPEIKAESRFTSNDNKNPTVKNIINRIIAYFFCTLPEGNGLLGRSTLSDLISNKSLETSPPRYNVIDEKINKITSWILLLIRLKLAP
jgi:hypothetical protein